MRYQFLLYLIFVFVLISCDEKKDKEYDLLITNASIVDVQNNHILRNKLIAISNDTIRFVGDMSGISTYEAKETFDAENRFVMPGLWDMHVHFRGGDSLINENKDFLPLFLSYGITTVRDAGGDITPAVLKWRKNINNGDIDGPRIFTSGPKLDGENPAWPGSIIVKNKEDASSALDSLQKLDVDYVKMYDGSLTPENYYAIIQEAEKRKMKITGHMPLSANFLTGIGYGLDGTEHMYYVIKACSPKADSLAKSGTGYGIMEELIDSYDPNLANRVFSKMKIQKVSITPTLHIGKTLAHLTDTDHSEDKTLAYIGEGIQDTYKGRVESAKRARASGNKMREKTEKLSASMIVPMYKAGVNIVAGSDSGAFNSFVYPGQSLHAELQELVNAGLTPQEALTTSIINGPKFFELSRYYGSLEKGKIGDIIVLEKNPLEDIKNTRSIKTIIKNDKIYTPDDLLDD